MLQYVRADWRGQPSTMPFGWIGQTAIAATAGGLDVEKGLLTLGVGGGAERLEAKTELTPAEYMLMCVHVINAVDDEMHGTTRARMKRGTASLGLKLFGTGRTLGESLQTLFRYYAIAGGFCRVSLTTSEHVAVIQISADGPPGDLTAVVEEMMATHLHMLISYYLGFFMPLGEFTTRSRNHPSLGRRHPYLDALTVAGEGTRLIFPSSYLDLPSRRQLDEKEPVDAAIYWLSCFEPKGASEFLSNSAGELSRKVYSSLVSGDLSFEQCCAAIGVGARTLRATLCAEGTTYRQLRKAALIERVRPYLEEHASTEDMAFGLGYSDARSLRRALKVATGFGLNEIRQPGLAVGTLPRGELIRNLRSELAQMA